MLANVSGMKNDRKVLYTYHMLDQHDEKHKVTAMARTTAYTASVVAQLVAKKTIEEKGVTPPEKIGMNEKLYHKFMSEMKKRRIIIQEIKKTLL
jgi:lysine 6-dehydrogenase